jgi:hypothetical protein
VWHDWYAGTVGTFGGLAEQAPGVGYEGHMYVVATPWLANGWTVLGEVGKFVPLSSKRFKRVSFAEGGAAGAGDDGPRVEVEGVAGEVIEVCAVCRGKNGPGRGAQAVALDKVCLKASFTAGATTQTLAFSRV